MFNRRYELGLVALLFVAWGTVFLDRMTLSFLAPYIKPDLGLDDAQIGKLNSVLALGWAASTFLFGALSDKIGRKPVLIPSLIAAAGLTAASGMVETYESLLIVRGLLGVAEGPILATMSALISESSSDRTRSNNIAIVLSAGTIIGLAIAPVLVTQVASTYDWHVAFYLAGAPVLIVAALMAFFVVEPRKQGAYHHHHEPTLKDFRNVLMTRNIWICSIAGSCFLSWLYLFNSFGPLYITEVQQQDPRTAGMVMGMSGAGGVVTGFILVWASGIVGRKAAALMMAIAAIFTPLTLMVVPLYDTVWLLALLVFITNCSLGITTLVIVVAASESVPRATAAAAIGMTSMFAEIIGATIMPSVGGQMANSFGLEAPLYMASASAAVMAVVILFLKFSRDKESQPVANTTIA
ncbi:MFS transporter [Candidatus Thalassolituus haligoni]|uniref:MFS transporter n=1 Tax=Candidatus Thalassolituus haligoni TaxID=3100113 RepID=UPI0035122F88|tara:strand:- start:6841 stop:8067 length:1227 start_codon:yes stop_codon:yes gene_type:complete